MSEEYLKKLIEKMTKEKEVVFHQINKKVEIDKPLRELVEEAIKGRESSLQYISEKTEHGHMVAQVYFFGNIAVVEEKWIPAFGFVWEERRLTLLKLKSPAEE